MIKTKLLCAVLVGMLLMWGTLTSLMVWTFSAVHPKDNMWTFALDWPARTYQIGQHYRGNKTALKWQKKDSE